MDDPALDLTFHAPKSYLKYKYLINLKLIFHFFNQ